MIKGLFNRNAIMSVVMMLVLTVGLTSCQSLQKKFTRKKKQDNTSTEFQPVLEPQDYPAPDKNPPELYKQQYALVKVWYKDLWAGIDERGSDATVRNSIKQISEQLDHMKVLLKPAKAEGLNRLAGLLTYYRTSLDQPRMTRNYSRIQSDLREFDHILRDQYRFDAVTDDLVQ